MIRHTLSTHAQRCLFLKAIIQTYGLPAVTLESLRAEIVQTHHYCQKQLGCSPDEARVHVEHFILGLPAAYADYVRQCLHHPEHGHHISFHTDSAEKAAMYDTIGEAYLLRKLSDGSWDPQVNEAVLQAEPFGPNFFEFLQLKNHKAYQRFVSEIYEDADHFDQKMRRDNKHVLMA